MPLEFNDDNFQRAARNVPNTLRIVLANRLQQHAIVFEKEMDKAMSGRLQGEWRRNNARSRLAARTGSLRRSFTSRIFGNSRSRDVTDLGVRCTVGDARTAPYARIHEYGGIIRPKRAKSLIIPMPDNLTTAGVARIASPRSVSDLFMLKKGRRAFLVRPTGESGKLEFLWMLAKSVRIPARLGMRRRWASKRMERDRIRKINEAVTSTMRKVGLK